MDQNCWDISHDPRVDFQNEKIFQMFEIYQSIRKICKFSWFLFQNLLVLGFINKFKKTWIFSKNFKAFYVTSHKTLLHIGPPGSVWSIYYWHHIVFVAPPRDFMGLCWNPGLVSPLASLVGHINSKKEFSQNKRRALLYM